MLLTCSLLKTNRASFHAPAIIAGLFFNNENWKVFRIMHNEFPTEEDYKRVTHIIIPGSTLCLSINVEPQIALLMSQLRNLFSVNSMVKYLGFCYGHQLLAEVLNPGSVRRSLTGAFELNTIEPMNQDRFSRYPFLGSYTRSLNMFEVHNDEVYSIPPGFIGIGRSSNCEVEMMVS